MKKLLAAILALVMALSLCSVSWADESERTKGYKEVGAADYSELPAAPDMSGTVVEVNAANAQYTLDGAYGSIDGKTIKFTQNITTTLILGRPTKYAGSNTKYYKDNFETEIDYAGALAVATSGRYVRTLSGVTFTAADGVTVAGLYAVSGHIYSTESTKEYDYVRDTGVYVDQTNTGYYGISNLKNITFSGITFIAKVNIASSLEKAEVSDVSFDGCTFNINNTMGASEQAIRFYSEEPTGKVGNLKVSGCVFNKCYHGVYAQDVNGVEVVGCKFDTIGYNAIAVQGNSGGTIDIRENYITGTKDRAIRFDKIAADATVKVNNNVMVNSGDTAGELFKATNLPTGENSVSLENNYWDGKTVEQAVVNAAVRPAKTGVTGGTFLGEVTPAMLADDVEAVKNNDGTYSVKPAEQKPSNNYYYYSSATDTTSTTKGSPKTFDAGIGIYAVTAVLSVTGMAWTAKKRH